MLTRNAVATWRHALVITAITVLVACGGQSTDSATPAAGESAQPAAPAAAEPAPAPAEAVATATEAGVQESAPADSAGGEQLKLASAAPQGEPTWRYKEGEHFSVLTTAQGLAGTPGKIEVVEAFWYGCPHCYEFDPMLSEWARGLPGDVSFVRLPVMWNPTNQIHARLFYTAQALGKLEEMNTAVFRELHVEKKMLTDEGDIRKFFERFGVSEADFTKTFRSFAVEGQLKRARDLTERYQVRSVPLLIVNGKYTTSAPGIRNYDDMLSVATELIERERRR